MVPFSWVRWLRSLWRPRFKPYRKPRRRPGLEYLETRLSPASYTWSGLGASTFWSLDANWVGNRAPTAAHVMADGSLPDLTFPDLSVAAGNPKLSPSNDLSGVVLNSISVSGSNYIIS